MEVSVVNVFALVASIIGVVITIAVSIAAHFMKETYKDNKQTADAVKQIPVELALIRSSLALVEEKNKASYRLLDERLNGFTRRIESLEADAANRNPPNRK